LSFLCALALALVGGSATPALAKGGVVARVLTPISRDARPGTTVTVVWTLYAVESGSRRPWSHAGPFIRLIGPEGSSSARVYATEPRPGRYRATVMIPRGGVRRVVIGLMGRRCIPGEGCWIAPSRFPIVGAPFR
jgi:hypothetical protein